MLLRQRLFKIASFNFSKLQNNKECYYKTLNLSISASTEQIKKEYLQLVKKYHPDSNPNSSNNQTEKFKQIQEAYEILSDPIKRDEYNYLITGDRRSSSQESISYKKYEEYKKMSKLTPEQERIKDIQMKINSGVPIEDITKMYNNIKSKHSQSKTISDKVWTELKYEYTQDYRTDCLFTMNKTYKDKYNIHNDEEVISNFQYFTKKEEDDYYSKPRIERMKMKIYDMVRIYKHYSFYIILMILYVTIHSYYNSFSLMILDQSERKEVNKEI